VHKQPNTLAAYCLHFPTKIGIISLGMFFHKDRNGKWRSITWYAHCQTLFSWYGSGLVVCSVQINKENQLVIID